MKSTEYEGGDLRLILAGMITDTKVCGRIIAAMEKPGGPRFESPLARIVVNWSREHWGKYGQVLNGTAGQYFKKWAETSKDAGTITQLERLLEYVSEEYATSSFAENSNYILDVATAYFKTQEARSRIEDAQDYLSDGKVDEALQQLSSINQIQLGYSAVFDPFKDIDVWIDRFAEDGTKPLFEYPGDLGELVGDVFTKGSLVGIQGVDKVGKSFFLLDAAWRALKNRKRVAYFECGDLGQDEMMRRLWQRIAIEPAAAGHVEWPEGWDSSDGNKPLFRKKLKGGLSLGRAVQLANRYVRKRHLFKLSCYPNSSISTVDIEGYLNQWAKESGWLPDMVCLAEGSLVLTNRGLVPIEKVTAIDKVWDGLSWVSQKGPVYKGLRKVITYDGLTATPDHKVWTKNGWRTLESCQRLGLSIAQTGIGGSAVRLSGDYLTRDSSSQKPDQLRASSLCLCEMCSMPEGEVGTAKEFENTKGERMSPMYTAQEIRDVALHESARTAREMLQSESRVLRILWREGNSIQFPFNCRGVFMDYGQHWRSQGIGIRQDRQRRTLRTWQSSMVNSGTESIAYQKESNESQSSPFPSSVSKCDLCGRDVGKVVSPRNGSRAGVSELGTNQTEMRKARTWDLVGCGPLHRFTVQGLLVHNCIDYADILAPANSRQDLNEQIDMTWKHLRRISQTFDCVVLTATQSGAQAYRTKSSVLTRKDFQGRRTKFAEVNSMLGIMAGNQDQSNGVVRVNQIVRRNGAYSEHKHVVVAGCLSCCMPIVQSRWSEYKTKAGKKDDDSDD